MWGALAQYIHCGARFLVLGDFRGQLLPAHNTIRGSPIAVDVEESAFLRELCGCRRFELTVNYRSDAALFDFYAPISAGGAEEHTPLEVLLARARKQFKTCTRMLETAPPTTHLTISNKARIHWNYIENAKDAEQARARARMCSNWMRQDARSNRTLRCSGG